MKSLTRIVYVGLIVACSLGINLAYAQATVHTPPEKITCTDKQCKLDDQYLPYLQVYDSGSNFEPGIYIFDHGFVYSYPASLSYYYKNDKGQEIEIGKTYSSIHADLSNTNWQTVRRTKSAYQCTALADECPFTNIPYLKTK